MPHARAKVFMHGGSQAVRLPKEFRFDAPEVNIRREGNAVILEPVKGPRTPAEWTAFWARIDAGRSDDDKLERPPQPVLPEWDIEA